MADLPIMLYTVRQQANRATGGVVYVPAIVERPDSVSLEEIVTKAIDRGLIVAIKPNAAKGVADGVARQMMQEFRQGNGVKFGDYFYARLYLDGTTDGNGTLVAERNGINVRLYKGEGFKLKLADFSWSNVDSGNIPAVDYAISDVDGAVRGILRSGEIVLLNGTNLWAEDDTSQEVEFVEVLPPSSADTPATATVTEFVAAGPNLLSFALPNTLPLGKSYTIQAKRTRGTTTFVSNKRAAAIAANE